MNKLKAVTFASLAALSLATVAKKAPSDSKEINDYLLPLDKKAVTFSQKLMPDENITLGKTSLSVSSKSYYQTINGAALKSGVWLYTTAEKAVVRITPAKSLVNGKTALSKTLEPTDLVLSGNNGEFNVSKSGMSIQASSQQLNSAHPSIFKNSSAFVIDKSMGKGDFLLKTNKSIDDNSKYLIHVFDKNSNVSLDLKSSQSSFSQGQLLRVKAKFSGNQNIDYAMSNAKLISPTGEQYDMSLNKGKTGVNANLKIDFDTQRKPGELWKVVFDMNSDSQDKVKRTAELAIDIHEKTARIAKVKYGNSGAEVSVNVDKPGRYEIRSWIFTGSGKRMEPGRIEYSAKWLDEGNHTFLVPLSSKKGLREEIKQLQLMDQSRLAVLDILEQ
ncbi:DUF4785 domain-containing protein [Pleionea sediminis]|uniref:DUF4785 domain-containing protein n=1 Tax=Pleionea sediminis TaxID=2569479 RepID=UPI001186A731|nr:DUF4785 domain-containing protein [Pleionea sediminis]